MIDALPPAPSRSDLPAVFIPKADALVAALATMVVQVNATAAGFSVTLWVTGTNYAQYALVYSPINLLTYRRVVAGAGATDPSLDSANWALVVDPGGPEPMNINPNWNVDQINEGALYTASGATVQGPDGWSVTATGAGVLKIRKTADPDNAAFNCLEITATTADAAIGATDNYCIFTAVEGYDAAALMAGTATPQSLAAQFKFKTSVAGVYGVSVYNSAANRWYCTTITVPDATEHEYFVTLQMDNAGVWLSTNGVGFYFKITLAAGANFQGAAGAWSGGTTETTNAQCNFMALNTNIAGLKRIQIFQGNAPRSYRSSNVQRELAKCQRYYVKTFAQGVAPVQNVGNPNGAIQTIGNPTVLGPHQCWAFPAEMRGAPTVTTYSHNTASANWATSTGTQDTVAIETSTGRAVVIASSTTTITGKAYIHATANARLA